MVPRSVLLALLFALLAPAALQAVSVGQQAPDFQLKQVWNTPSGGESSLASFRGRVVLLEVFATW
ncbi:MAG: hypothetical protein IT463_09065 [Planctomycetes bacterium]|nr:hypothetical protein [Planctomycetota bacterium]